MRAYVGLVDPSGLRRFLPEDAIPRDLLRQLIRGWFSRTTAVVRAAVAQEDAEAVRREREAGYHRDACNLLLNRAVELLPLVSAPPDLAGAASN